MMFLNSSFVAEVNNDHGIQRVVVISCMGYWKFFSYGHHVLDQL